MKRLRKKLSSLICKDFRQRRDNRRLLLAEWVPADVGDPNLVQYITDVMSTGGNIQIEYNGEWKTIAPYGWNSSKSGNVLLMCYKDTGEVRSYRLDRITNVQFDSDVIDTSMFAGENGEESANGEELSVDGLEVPTLPEEQTDEFGGTQEPAQQSSPFEDAIQTLEEVSDEPTAEETTDQPQQDLDIDPNMIADPNVINNPEDNVQQEVNPEEVVPEENKQPA